MAPKAPLLKATAKFKQLARKARAEVARRRHVRRLPSSQDGRSSPLDARGQDRRGQGAARPAPRLPRAAHGRDGGRRQLPVPRRCPMRCSAARTTTLPCARRLGLLRSHEADFAPFVGRAHRLGASGAWPSRASGATRAHAPGGLRRAFAVGTCTSPPPRRRSAHLEYAACAVGGDAHAERRQPYPCRRSTTT